MRTYSMLRTLALLVAAGAVHAGSISVNGPLTNNGSNSSCTYTSVVEQGATGNWTVACGAGPNAVTISPALCGSVCTSYSSVTMNALGAWTVTGCVNAGGAASVALTQPASPITIDAGVAYTLKANASACLPATVAQVEFWAGAAMIPGAVVTAAPYNYNWTPANGTYTIVAKAKDSNGVYTTSSPVTVRANAAPVVTTTVLPLGTRAAPAKFTLTATVTDTDAISSISWLGTGVVPAPTGASYVWNNVPAGIYFVVARATDSLGRFGDSSPVRVEVTSTNQMPTVSMTKPIAGASPTRPVDLEATAADADGEIVKVDYYNAETNTLIGTSTTVANNYRVTWTDPLAGPRHVVARAYDNTSVLSGTYTQSAEVVFTIVEPFRLTLHASQGAPPFFVAPATVTLRVMGLPSPPALLQINLWMDGVDQGPMTLNLALPGYEKTVSGVSAGSHAFVARATATDGRNGASNVNIVTIDSGNITPAPNVCAAEASGTSPGAIAGTPAVSDSGGASYSIPIQIPPAIAGLAPSLGLSYNSQDGNGPMGMGWSLHGLSTIHRCAKNVFIDGQKGAIEYLNEPLCMDGQRLVPISGSDRNGLIEYRTEREGYSRIQSSNPLTTDYWIGPAYFKVWTKSGQILHYGYKVTEVSNPYAAPQDAVIRTTLPGKETARIWALYKIEDRSGNYVLIDYDTSNSNGTLRPLKISYTGNSVAQTAPPNRIDFIYEDRSDFARMYSAGEMTNDAKRLKYILTLADFNTIKRYTFNYANSLATGRSLLTSVQECSGDAGLCVGATNFTFPNAATVSRSFDVSSIPWTGTTIGGDRDTTVAVDVNGDGKTDLVSRAPLPLMNQWDVCKSTGGNYDCQRWTSGERANGQGRDDIWNWADFDGDGKADLVYANPNLSGFLLQLSTGNGFLGAIPATVSWRPLFTNEAYARTVGDFNGDGRADLALYMGNFHWKFCSLNTASQFLCSGEVTVQGADQPDPDPNAGFDFLVGDLNGDGRADIAFHGNNSSDWRVCYSTSQQGSFSFDCSVTMVPATPGNAYNVHVADLNGDGMADLVSPVEPFVPGQWKVCLSKGDKTFDCSVWIGPISPVWNAKPGIDRNKAAHTETVLGDFNGDGRTDLAWYIAGQGWHVCESTGTSFNCSTYAAGATVVPIDDIKNIRAGDFNGDGRTDIAAWGINVPNWNVGISSGGASDLMTRVTNGLGAFYEFIYAPLTNGQVYAKDATAATYPVIDIQSPMYVVRTMFNETGVAQPILRLDYSYRGLKGHSQGGGIAGFTGRVVADTISDSAGTRVLCSETEIETDWNERRIGLVKKVTKRHQASVGVGSCSGGTVLSQLTNTWSHRLSGTFGGGSTPQVHEIFLTASHEDRTDLSGTALPSSDMLTPMSQIDFMGNPLNVQTSAGDGYFRTTINTYLNDVSTWIIGRVQRSSVTSTTPSAGQDTRVSTFQYRPVSGLLYIETVEPDRLGTSQYLNTEYSHDVFGNRLTARLTGLGVDRTTTTRYCRTGTDCPANAQPPVYDGRFATYMQNAGGHVETRVYHKAFGVVTQFTGPNQLSTTSLIDRLGRTYCETRADGSTTGFSWASGGDAGIYYATTTDSTGATKQQHFDRLNREIAVKTNAFDGSLSVVSTRFDGRGRNFSTTKPYGATLGTTTRTYDDLNRVKSESGPGTYSATYLYDGLSTSVTLAASSGPQTTQRQVNSRGEVVRVIDARNTTMQLTYDGFGNLVAKSGSAVGEVIPSASISFNSRGQKYSMTDPDHGTWTYGYNALGEMTSQTDARQIRSTFEYDDIGRMKRRVEGVFNGQPGLPPTTWTYDAVSGVPCGVKSVGRLCKVDSGANTTKREFWYDDKSRQSSVMITHYGGQSFRRFTTYDSMSRVRKITYPVTGFALQHEYNAQGYMYQITRADTSASVVWWGRERFADGQIKVQQLHGQQIDKTYDALGRVATIFTAGVQDAAYSFDAIGNLVSRSDGITQVTESFQYDTLNRLIAVSGPSPRTYDYSAAGNLKFRSDLGTLTYVPGTHRLQTVNGVGYTYDANGNFNFTSDFNRVVGHTAFGMIQSIDDFTGPGMRQGYSYDYDGDHRRIAEYRMKNGVSNSMTYYFSDGVTPFFEEDQDIPVGGGERLVTWKHYVNTPEGISEVHVVTNDFTTQPQGRLFAKDHLGSTVAVYGDVPVERLGYDAWGRRRNSNGTANPAATSLYTDRGFTGHEMMDVAGLVNMNGRVYDPAVGRFLQPDLIVQDYLNLQNYNRYSYVLNNPLSLTDPTGYSWWTDNGRPAFKAVAAIVVAYFTGYYDYGTWGVGVFGAGGTGSVLGGASAFGNSVAAGFAAGGIQGGNLQSAVHGALAGGLTFGVLAGIDALISESASWSMMADASGAMGPPELRYGEKVVVTASRLRPFLDPNLMKDSMGQFILIGPSMGLGPFRAAPYAAPAAPVVKQALVQANRAAGKVGEDFLKRVYGGGAAGRNTSMGMRYIDNLANGVAQESKVGYTSLSARIEAEVAKDAELIATPGSGINRVEWHFFPSKTGIGPSAPLLERLELCGFKVCMHP